MDIRHQKVFHLLNNTKILVFTAGRKDNSTVKPVPNLLTKGAKTIESSTLKTFNQKMKVFHNGEAFVPEIDEVGAADFTFDTKTSDDVVS